MVAARHTLGHGSDDGLRRVPAEHRDVRDDEIRVGEHVDVGEARTAALADPERRVVVAPSVPGHRHAVRHHFPSTGPELGRAGSLGVEPGVLGVLQLADEGVIDRGRARHARSVRGVARGRIELPTPRFSAACSTN